MRFLIKSICGYFNNSRIWLIPVTIALWGISMELLQSTKIIGRTFDVWDEIANIAGFFPGWLAFIYYKKLKYKY